LQTNRFGRPIGTQTSNGITYDDLLVRFDYRNPNHHPETGEPIGDFSMCDDLADQLIDVKKANAKHAFKTLIHHFEKIDMFYVYY
jgi:hypothetical protein